MNKTNKTTTTAACAKRCWTKPLAKSALKASDNASACAHRLIKWGIRHCRPIVTFADKEALLAEIAALALSSWRKAYHPALLESARHRQNSASLPPRVNYAIQNPEKYRLMFGPAIKDRQPIRIWWNHVRPYLALLRQFIGRAKSSVFWVLSQARWLAAFGRECTACADARTDGLYHAWICRKP